MRRAAAAVLSILAVIAIATVARDQHAAPASQIELENDAIDLLGNSTVCGSERWDVKTLSDSAARGLNYTAHASTVNALRAVARPAGLGTKSPRQTGAERTTYKLTVKMIEAKLEGDRDIHIVVEDPKSTKTMIVELSDTTCSGASSSYKKAAIAAARSAFLKACGTPAKSSFTRLGGTATVTGTGFFDQKHGQTGIAPNAMELHPVLSFSTKRCRT